MPNIQKRIIKVSQAGKTLYEGEDKRFYNQDYKQLKCALGIPLFEWLKIAGWAVGIIVFLVKADIRVKALEEGQIRLINVSENVQAYMNNADTWNSSIYGTRFRGGAPVDGSYRKNEGYIKRVNKED